MKYQINTIDRKVEAIQLTNENLKEVKAFIDNRISISEEYNDADYDWQKPKQFKLKATLDDKYTYPLYNKEILEGGYIVKIGYKFLLFTEAEFNAMFIKSYEPMV